ncbi:MAG TPA: hypothetical protein PLM75_03575 [bacterium]|nr:hypothetical protein [bacterium]
MLQCYKCQHFEIRYSDPINRYGCSALGFKSVDANWYWLHMPCPCFVENPKRKKRQPENNNENENNKQSDNRDASSNIIDIVI